MPRKSIRMKRGTLRKRNGRRSTGQFAYTFIYSGAAVDAGALRLSIAGNSLTGPAGSKVLPKCRMTEPLARRRLKMSHDGAAGTQAPQNVA